MRERSILSGMIVGAAVLLLAGGWSLGHQEGAPVARRAAAQPIEAVPAPEVCQGYVALTFDDGPTLLSRKLLGLLAERGVPATFFYTGEHAAKLPDTVRAAVKAGHQIGNHTWDHPDLRARTDAQVADELRRTSDVLTPLAGPITMFRSPFGSTSEKIRAQAAKLGMSEVLWTADTKDFEATSSAAVLARSAGMTDGGILLLHDGNELTLQALPRIINAYHERGMCFGRLAPTGSPQVLPWLPELPYYVRASAPSTGPDHPVPSPSVQSAAPSR